MGLIVESNINIQGIAGLNMIEGIKKVGGSKKRYLRILSAFILDAESGWNLLDDEPTDSTLNSVTTMVHGLKSALRNIGHDSLSREALTLEEAGRRGDLDMVREKLPAFKVKLSSLIDKIRQITAAAEESGKAAKAPDSEVSQAVIRLRSALESKNINGIDEALEVLQALNLPVTTKKTISEIADSILTADFQKASELINDLGANNP
jgi:HPt (histidine-containing phosphotransfer) domain-containing protein